MKCWLCSDSLVLENKTKEHVVPGSIGGRKEVGNFICRNCNSKHGDRWEAEVAKQFLWFSSVGGVKRAHGGEHPDLLVQTTDGEKLKLQADGGLALARPKVEVQKTDNDIRVVIRSNDERTALNLVRKVAKDYPDFDVEKALREIAVEESFPNHILHLSMKYGGPHAGRSMVKSCLALLADAGMSPDACGRALAYLKDQSLDAPHPFCIFFDEDLLVDRPTDHLFHCVSVVARPQERRILGYVEFFNYARILVSIAEDYDGVAFQKTYAVDPVRGRELDMKVDFGRLNADLRHHFSVRTEPPPACLEAFATAVRITSGLGAGRLRSAVISNAGADALHALGLDPDSEGDLSSELRMEWTELMLRNLQPYLESQLARIRHGLPPEENS